MSDKKPETQIENEKRSGGSKKKTYSAPKLEKLGDLRTLTLGGSPGTGDLSGNPSLSAPLPPP